jgi:hypothetical protein
VAEVTNNRYPATGLYVGPSGFEVPQHSGAARIVPIFPIDHRHDNPPVAIVSKWNPGAFRCIETGFHPSTRAQYR